MVANPFLRIAKPPAPRNVGGLARVGLGGLRLLRWLRAQRGGSLRSTLFMRKVVSTV